MFGSAGPDAASQLLTNTSYVTPPHMESQICSGYMAADTSWVLDAAHAPSRISMQVSGGGGRTEARSAAATHPGVCTSCILDAIHHLVCTRREAAQVAATPAHVSQTLKLGHPMAMCAPSGLPLQTMASITVSGRRGCCIKLAVAAMPEYADRNTLRAPQH